MINNNITCNIIKISFIILTLTNLLTYFACVLSRCASKYIITLLTYILALLLCVTKLTIYILLCINARTLQNLKANNYWYRKVFGRYSV